MGALHAGHAALIAKAGSSCSYSYISADQAVVLVSIFVNPLQFAPGEDFECYPRQLHQDLLLAAHSGACAVWAPYAEEILPGAGKSGIFQVVVPSSLTAHLCGPGRSAHFNGVATVVARLLMFIQPHLLVLGEKDWQQLVIIRQMIAELGLPVRVRGVATVREPDGLASSSRNRYLSPEERLRATKLQSRLLEQSRSAHPPSAKQLAVLSQQLREDGLAVEYVEAVDPATLQPQVGSNKPTLLAAAVRCGTTRLIDHIFWTARRPIVAIDGPAGAGKSSVTHALANRLGLLHLDTGAMYRAVTWLLLNQGIDPTDRDAIQPALENISLQLELLPDGNQMVQINNCQVSEVIRSPIVTAAVPVVAAHRCVRQALTAQQRRMGSDGGLVAEGRDVGTAIFPDAEVKIFLTASPAERSRRRALDLQRRGFAAPDLHKLELQIRERDQLDSNREEAPLLQAANAVEIVTDGMDVEAVVSRLEDLFRLQIPEEIWPTPVH